MEERVVEKNKVAGHSKIEEKVAGRNRVANYSRMEKKMEKGVNSNLLDVSFFIEE